MGTPDPVGGDVQLGAFNVLNYFLTFGGVGRGATSAAELEEQARQLEHRLTLVRQVHEQVIRGSLLELLQWAQAGEVRGGGHPFQRRRIGGCEGRRQADAVHFSTQERRTIVVHGKLHRGGAGVQHQDRRHAQPCPCRVRRMPAASRATAEEVAQGGKTIVELAKAAINSTEPGDLAGAIAQVFLAVHK